MKGCKHYKSKVISKYADGGKVEKTRPMPDGSQQYVRGNTKSERLDTLIKAGRAADRQYSKAWEDVDKLRSSGKAHSAALAKTRKTFKASRAITNAFIQEARAKD